LTTEIFLCLWNVSVPDLPPLSAWFWPGSLVLAGRGGAPPSALKFHPFYCKR